MRAASALPIDPPLPLILTKMDCNCSSRQRRGAWRVTRMLEKVAIDLASDGSSDIPLINARSER